MLGDVSCNLLVQINVFLSLVRRNLGRSGYWSLPGYALRRVKWAFQFIFDLDEAIVHAARTRGGEEVICGHIHSAKITEID